MNTMERLDMAEMALTQIARLCKITHETTQLQMIDRLAMINAAAGAGLQSEVNDIWRGVLSHSNQSAPRVLLAEKITEDEHNDRH